MVLRQNGIGHETDPQTDPIKPALRNSGKGVLILLVFLQVLIFFPFRFTTGMPDRDSYRMLLGMLDDAARGTHFSSPMLYNRQVSYGYYALIYTLISPFGRTPSTIVAAMNGVSLLVAILFVIPFYLVVERLFGMKIAFAASVILGAVPVWWSGALYGHPTMPGVFWFFCALAVIARNKAAVTGLTARLLVICLLAAALSFRFDLVLLFPALAAVIWYRYRQPRQFLKETFFYIAGAVLLFKLGQLALPTVQGGLTPETVLDLLHRYQDPSRIFGSIHKAIVEPLAKMGSAFSPLLLIIALPAFWIVWRRRDMAQILFTVVVLVLSWLFWLPNPDPLRHYLPTAPATSTAAAVSGLWLVSKLASARIRTIVAWSYGPIVAVCCVAVSLTLPFAPGRLANFESPFLSRFSSDDYRSRASQLAADLVSVQGSKEPVLVLCDANFVAARMQMLARGVTVQLHPYHLEGRIGPLLFYEVDYDGRQFMMLEQSFYPDLVKAALDRLDLYPSYPVLVDPYNSSVVYRGKRPRAHLERSAAGEQIKLDAASHSIS